MGVGYNCLAQDCASDTEPSMANHPKGDTQCISDTGNDARQRGSTHSLEHRKKKAAAAMTTPS